MSFFRKLFRIGDQKSKATPVQPASTPVAPSDVNSSHQANSLSKNDEMIQAFTKDGIPIYMSREEWYKKVAPSSSTWDHPDELYTWVCLALRDGYVSHAMKWAQRLHEIDPDRARSTCVLGVALLTQKHLDEAENLYRDFLDQHGECGVILVNLAKIYAQRNDHAKSEEILWHALEVDPNQDNGLQWYQAIEKERGGEHAQQAALLKVAALPGSWRARMWLAYLALEHQQLEEAITYYRESLSLAPRPIPTDLLKHMSGDMGSHGHLKLVLELVAPHFNVRCHGLEVGNNLIKVHLELGHFDAAYRIVEELHKLKRPDWKQGLAYWENEIRNARIKAQPINDQPLQTTMLLFDDPVWSVSGSPTELFGTAKPKDELLICFQGSSVQRPTAISAPQLQRADNAGRMSRVLPLFLAEQIHFGTHARTKTLIPYVIPTGAFLLLGQPWTDEDVLGNLKQSVPDADFVVVTHVTETKEPWDWRVDLRLLRVADSACLAKGDIAFPLANPEFKLRQLAQQLSTALIEHTEVQSQSIPTAYHVPEGDDFRDYLLRLEQLLAVRCAAMKTGDAYGLSGEREILEGNIRLCTTHPRNVTTRMVLAHTISAMKKVRPNVVSEFQGELLELEKKYPMDGTMNGILRRIIEEEDT